MFALPEIRSTGAFSSSPRSAESGLGIGPRETRQAVNGMLTASGRTLTGYAAVFEQETRILGVVEVIRRGAFTASLAAKGDVVALVDHDPARLLARTKSGSLRLEEDTRGLRFSLDVPDTQAGRDCLALAERGDLGGCSFGFIVPPGGETWQGKRRELRSVNLMEISIVSAWPAYAGTSVQARALTPRLAAALRWLETV